MKDRLKIGWGKRSIAPDGPVPICGQFYLRVSAGQYTPVLASALAISNKQDAVIFVTVDMVSFPAEGLKRIQAILKKEAPEIPVEKIILNSTHTHAGPSIMSGGEEYSKDVKILPPAKVLAFVTGQIADAVKEAWNSRAPGAIAYGYGFATVGHSRRTVYQKDVGKRNEPASGLAVNGRAVMYGKTNDKLFDGFEAGTDAFINLLYTFDKNDRLTGAVVNVPCPAQTNEHAWMLHAGFWHHVREKLTAKYGPIGVIGQAAAAGDLSPRQLFYNAAELRRYRLKYKDKIDAYMKEPMLTPFSGAWTPEQVRKQAENDLVDFMRAEDIAGRIADAFEEVLGWAGQEKFSDPDLRHEVRTVELSRRLFPDALVEEEKRKHEEVMKIPFKTDGTKWERLIENSRLNSRRHRIGGILARWEKQEKEPTLTTVIHAVRLGNIAFATNRFELFMDYRHRIQARSPFEQTFIVQLVTDRYGAGTYLATEKAVRNKGYSATPYCNLVSPKGGQELVEETLKMLEEMK
ncbi:MAG: hypothetical protein IKO93_04910 [Lentisphaeria bacterium]|nr:hypothetical protein [Lentisphaeria bacterium]